MFAGDNTLIDDLRPFQRMADLVSGLIARDKPLDVRQNTVGEMGRSVDCFFLALAASWKGSLRSSVGKISVVLISMPPGPSK